MVKINFLNQDKELEKFLKFKIKISYLFISFMMLISFFQMIIFMISSHFLENKLERGKKFLSTLEIKTLPTKKRIDENKKIINTLKNIENLNNQKLSLVKALDALTINMTDEIWLISLEKKDSGVLLIEGKAFSDLAISNFVSNMKKIKFFKKINLKFTKVNLVKNTKIKDFKIEATLNF